MNVPTARNGFKRSQTLITISRHMTSELPSTPSLVVHVAKHFTTTLPTTLIFAPHIQLHSLLQLTNLMLKKPQMCLLQKNLRGRIKQCEYSIRTISHSSIHSSTVDCNGRF